MWIMFNERPINLAHKYTFSVVVPEHPSKRWVVMLGSAYDSSEAEYFNNETQATKRYNELLKLVGL